MKTPPLILLALCVGVSSVAAGRLETVTPSGNRLIITAHARTFSDGEIDAAARLGRHGVFVRMHRLGGHWYKAALLSDTALTWASSWRLVAILPDGSRVRADRIFASGPLDAQEPVELPARLDPRTLHNLPFPGGGRALMLFLRFPGLREFPKAITLDGP